MSSGGRRFVFVRAEDVTVILDRFNVLWQTLPMEEREAYKRLRTAIQEGYPERDTANEGAGANPPD